MHHYFKEKQSEQQGLWAFYRFSKELERLDTTGQCVLTENSLYLRGQNRRFNVFSLDGSSIGGSGIPFLNVTDIVLDAPEDSINVLNIRGAAPVQKNIKKEEDRTLLLNFTQHHAILE